MPASANARPLAAQLVDPYLGCLAGAAAVVLACAIWTLPRGFAQMGPLQWALLAGLMLASWMILNHLILFDWRGQRVALGPDEVLVFLALLVLPASFVVLFAVPSMALYQAKTRRPLLRASSNVAVVLLSGGACVAAYTLALPVAPRVIAIMLAIVTYTLTTHVLVASVFSLRESEPLHVVFGERFWVPSLLHIALGISGGVAAWALWSFHPAALAALIPFVYLAREHVGLVARTEREALVHKKLGETTRSLVGERDLDAVADRVLTMCGALFHAGTTTLVLEADGNERRWQRAFEGGAKPDAPMAATLEGPGGAPLGAIIIHESRRTNAPFAEVDRALLRIVAAETAAAVANAQAMRDLDAARERLVSTRVARPLVRRIVRSLIEETRADSIVMMRLGSSLASEADAADLATFSRAYEEMGLGQVESSASSEGRYEFVGHDLFERTAGSRAATCYLALGYATGVVSKLHAGASAKGAEIECESRGDARCRFVVHLRDET